MKLVKRTLLPFALAALAAGADAQLPYRPMPLPDAASPAGSTVDTRTADQRKQDVAYAAASHNLSGLVSGMARACRLQSWQFALRPEANNAVRLDASPTLSNQQADCLKSVIYASRFHLLRH